MAEPNRRPAGNRQDDESVVSRLPLIRRAKELGFTLPEIKELLSLWCDANTKCVHVRQRAERKVRDIEGKILSLQRMKRSLKRSISQCENRDAVAECPLWLGLDEPCKNVTADSSIGQKRKK